MGLEWDTFDYWIDRAAEIKYGKLIPLEIESKVDDETFERQTQRLIAKIEKMRASKEGRVNG